MLRSVAAVAALLGRESIDLRRITRVGGVVKDEDGIRLLMGLYASPLNRSQAARLIRGGLGVAGGLLIELRNLGLADDDGRPPESRVFHITEKGRRLLVSLIEAASESDEPLPLRVDAATPTVNLFESTGMRLAGDRLARAEAC